MTDGMRSEWDGETCGLWMFCGCHFVRFYVDKCRKNIKDKKVIFRKWQTTKPFCFLLQGRNLKDDLTSQGDRKLQARAKYTTRPLRYSLLSWRLSSYVCLRTFRVFSSSSELPPRASCFPPIDFPGWKSETVWAQDPGWVRVFAHCHLLHRWCRLLQFSNLCDELSPFLLSVSLLDDVSVTKSSGSSRKDAACFLTEAFSVPSN